ncbi:rhomboid family intramembrane serine protease [Lysobacter sp. A6]|uniref:Rhomboid family intramembrane serine protease n=1 Tax=Noviluteimonas lactosilytica TaxID=2888523 RepID=A0ABS8JDZ9_9GAMM|nr:rhomboid family intramembrane serine protease [Lysobacter lactosilyticus]MCC8361829.1 rhomboid family intramembrane serine protease [Lysobacter lactosilyticus]
MFQTWILIGITVVVSWLAFERPRLLDRLTLWPPAIDKYRQYDRLVTHAFVHADWMHLLFNMITLFFFGPRAETFYADAAGPLAYPLFYIAAILVAILPTYARHRHDARYRSLGASGAVSAVLFTYVLLNPWGMIGVMFIPVPAIVFGVLYLGYSWWADQHGAHGNVNHSAHFWGAAFGTACALVVDPSVFSTFLARLMSPSFL